MDILASLLDLGYQRNWDRLLAKGGKYRETSLINHSFSVASITYDLLLLKKDFFSDQEIKLAVVAAFLHDLDKEAQEFQKRLKSSEAKSVQHLPSLDKFLETIKQLGYSEAEGKFAYGCLIHTHIGAGEAVSISSIKSELLSELKDSELNPDSISTLGDFIRLADSLVSSSTALDVKTTLSRESYASLLKQLGLKTAIFSLGIIRGHLSYLLFESAEKAFEKQNFVSLVNFPNGVVAFSSTNDVNYEVFSQDFVQILENNLKQLFVHEDFLKESINAQINRSMIGEESVITLESLKNLIKYAHAQIMEKSFSEKKDLSIKEQREAILLRFVIFLLRSLKNKASKLYPEESSDISSIIDNVQLEIFGRKIDELGQIQKYEPFRDTLYNEIEKFLISTNIIDRSFNEMPEEDALGVIKELGFKFAELLQSRLVKYEKLTLQVKAYLEQLMDDVEFPELKKDTQDIFSRISKAYQGYQKGKHNIMGSMSERDIRCPICGSVRPGTIAKKASVGEGTKKFTNLGKGYGTLDNVNICMLCAIEGILRKGKQLTFFVFPEVPFSPSQLNHIYELYKRVGSISLKYKEVAEDILFSEYKKIREKVMNKILSEKEKKSPTFIMPQRIRGNYLVLCLNKFIKTTNTTTRYLLLALSGIYLQIVTNMKVKIVQGLDILDVEKIQGFVEFPVTQNMLTVLELRKGSLFLEQISDIGEKIALGYRLWDLGKLSESGGIINALRIHPGQVLERYMIKSKSRNASLRGIYYKIFKKAKVKIMEKEELISKENIPEKLADILEEYYWKPRATSMHMILGPVSALYDEYRLTTKYTPEVAQYIAGKVYRKLEMQSGKKFGLEKAAEEIYQICLSLNNILSSMSLRQKKKYLDNLRYSVYLLRIMKASERQEKKKKKEDEK